MATGRADFVRQFLGNFTNVIMGAFYQDGAKANLLTVPPVTATLAVVELPQAVAASQAVAAGIYHVDATLGNVVLSLPAVLGTSGMSVRVKKVDAGANTVTISPAGPETIDGAPNLVLFTQYEYVRIVSDGANWFVHA